MDKKYLSDRRLYLSELLERVLPFWENNAPDPEHGGFFTCFSNDGAKLLSEDKYIWSQGRILWVLSRILRDGLVSGARADALRCYADATYRFLAAHSLDGNGHAVFLTDRAGNVKQGDTSLYVDCFVVMGAAEYAAYAGDRRALAFAASLFETADRRRAEGGYRTDPYPAPSGYRMHGVPMIFTNTARVLADAMAALGHPDAARISDLAYATACEVLDGFVDGADVLHEAVPLSGGFDFETLLGRYINPGHTIEDCWFLETEWRRAGDVERHGRTLRVLKNALSRGWDGICGGIRLFADHTGRDPLGTIADPSEPMVKKVTCDHGSKLWWVHSEALYTTLLFSDDPTVAAWYGAIRAYTLATFPNRENGRGEWIQIRDREGMPENRVVALPVKDPYHIMRNLLLIIELLKGDSHAQL